MANIGAWHLAANPKLYEPARVNNFVLLIHFDQLQDKFLKAGISVDAAEDDDYILADKAQEYLAVAIAKAFVPHYKLDEIEIQRGNTTVYFPGVAKYDSGTLVIQDYMGARIKSILMAWRRCTFDEINETIATADKYKVDCTLVEYSPDYATILRQWDLKGCWITSLSEGDFDNTTSGNRQIDCTIRFDKAIPIDEAETA